MFLEQPGFTVQTGSDIKSLRHAVDKDKDGGIDFITSPFLSSPHSLPFLSAGEAF